MRKCVLQEKYLVTDEARQKLGELTVFDLYHAGYEDHPRWSGMVFRLQVNRFHAYFRGIKIINLHYDKTKKGKHHSKGHETRIMREIARIHKIKNSLRGVP